jgi:hypothetical protein
MLQANLDPLPDRAGVPEELWLPLEDAAQSPASVQ